MGLSGSPAEAIPLLFLKKGIVPSFLDDPLRVSTGAQNHEDEVIPGLLHTTAKEATEVNTATVQVLMCLCACHPSALSIHFSSCAFALEVHGKSCRPCAGACNWSLQGYRIAVHFKSSAKACRGRSGLGVSVLRQIPLRVPMRLPLRIPLKESTLPESPIPLN